MSFPLDELPEPEAALFSRGDLAQVHYGLGRPRVSGEGEESDAGTVCVVLGSVCLDGQSVLCEVLSTSEEGRTCQTRIWQGYLRRV